MHKCDLENKKAYYQCSNSMTNKNETFGNEDTDENNILSNLEKSESSLSLVEEEINESITTSTVVFRRSLIPFINFLEYNYVIGEDYFIWIKLSEKFNLVNLTKKLTTYRITNNGMMANTVNKYEEAINYIHNYQFEKIGLNNRYDLISIHNKFMFTNNITQIYLKKSLILYKILLSNSINTYDHISFLEQIRINWLRKLIVYSKNKPIKSIYIYFKYFKYHNYKSILNIYKLIIFSMYYLFKKNNVFN